MCCGRRGAATGKAVKKPAAKGVNPFAAMLAAKKAAAAPAKSVAKKAMKK